MLCAMAVGTGLVLFAGTRRDAAPAVPAPEQRPPEEPWLAPEAAAQVIGAGGLPGPLFSDLMLGGPPPSPEVRARIQAFARANHVDIHLDVADRGLAAIRFDVTFGGCCGYEGADVLAMRLGRPRTQECCGCEKGWADDWTTASEDGSVHMSARVRVNHVSVRWEREATLPDLLDSAEALLDRDAATVAKQAGDRWIRIEPHRYLLEFPYQFVGGYLSFSGSERLEDRYDLGMQVTVDQGRISEVTFVLHPVDDPDALHALLRSRWGGPRVGEDGWTWRTPDRIVVADTNRITIQKR